MITAEHLLELLDKGDLEVIKTTNNQRNIGKTAILVLTELLNEDQQDDKDLHPQR